MASIDKKELRKNLTDNIKFYLKKKGLKQKELAEMIGVSPSRMNNIITVDSIPQIETLIDIAQALDISVDTLLGLEVKEKTDTFNKIVQLNPLDIELVDLMIDKLLENEKLRKTSQVK